jgi:hypothetical protein
MCHPKHNKQMKMFQIFKRIFQNKIVNNNNNNNNKSNFIKT